MLGHCEIIKQLMYIDNLNVPIAIMFYLQKYNQMPQSFEIDLKVIYCICMHVSKNNYLAIRMHLYIIHIATYFV